MARLWKPAPCHRRCGPRRRSNKPGDIQRRRREIEAANRLESEMDELFRSKLAHGKMLLRGSPYAARVGAFEGANYEARGFYRPQVDCIVFTRNTRRLLAVCRRAIHAILDLYSR
jgi:hypothetical protein